MAKDGPEEALTEEEIAGTAPANSDPPTRNAFTALMTSKRQASPGTSSPNPASKKPHSRNPVLSRRDGLGAYLKDPSSCSNDVVIYHTPSFVIINDLYPKSSVHTLLLPRAEKYNRLHPFEAFEDAEFLSLVRAETKEVEKLVATELQRKYGKFSKEDEPYQKALRGETKIGKGDPIPTGRDWSKEVISGVHAVPSMNHLHIHILSVDRISDCLKHRKHYNSFATDFFVPLSAFPLGEEDERRAPDKMGYLKSDFKCWRCGKGFGNRFQELKVHLQEEFEVWKRI